MILYAEGDWDELRICRVEAFLASYLPKPMGFSVFQFIMHILGTIAESWPRWYTCLAPYPADPP